ncbi:hypothetical protein [Cupriavidus metallidurans]|uniref:hypothetical protein n=1 Tax=Cupriavidus metallidurans TaxID=119219 RepID=UPI001645BC42|nr:hypothetical protein [Cupriavidus metallidurans]
MKSLQSMPTIVVHLDGGRVRHFESDDPVIVIVVDHDAEGTDAHEVKTLPKGGAATVRQQLVVDVARETAEAWRWLARG